ncbi:VanZ family protein [Bacillus sp. FJAT-29790]|uniref:VanZ family protein n=1 Tax=Bacillus sp. FJAT-29790 TaxID=1895002 RepID=UPI001C243B02|nr:VanZ family protein [Bacillus sp. FJAT-29790]MBU8881079.1 VanZ family protein [Bacillus sp. FJAT-29790]
MGKWMIRALPFFYMGLVWILSNLPHNAVIELPDSSIDRFFKESMHLIEFAILYLLFVLAALTTGSFSKKMNLVFAITASFYGIIDEIHQSFVPYRSATLIDVVKDIIGVLICWYFIDRASFHQRFPKLSALLRYLKRLKKGEIPPLL